MRKGLIELLDQSGCCAEVGFKRNEVKEKRFVAGDFKAHGFNAREELGVGVAEEIDRLHGVADNKAGASSPLGPCGDEAGEQLVLAAAGVLEFVDQKVANAVGDSNRGVRGEIVVALEHALGNLRDLDEVHSSGFGKGDSQLARCPAQQREAGAHNLPVIFGIACRG